jgi:hypothetical protein
VIFGSCQNSQKRIKKIYIPIFCCSSNLQPKIL